MNRIILLCLLASVLFKSPAQVVFETAFPQPGQTIAFTYTPQAHLKEVADLDAYVLMSDGNPHQRPKTQKVALQKSNQVWKGTISTQADTKAIALGIFEAGKTEADNNNGKGYTQVLYDAKKKPLPGAYMSLAIIGDYHKYLGIDKKQIKEWIKQEFKSYPESKRKYPVAYMQTIPNDDKLIRKEISTWEKKQDLSEDEMIIIYRAYEKFKKDNQKAQMWKDKILATYPKGNFAENLEATAIYAEKNTEKRNELIKNFLQKFPNSKQKASLEAMIYWQNIKAAAEAKEQTKVKQLLAEVPTELSEEVATNANSYAWDLAEKQENLSIAEMLSKFTIEATKNKLLSSQEDKSSRLFEEYQINYTLGMYLDTYGWVLYKQNRYLEALGAFREAISVYEYNKEDTEYLERYFLAQDKAETQIIRKPRKVW